MTKIQQRVKFFFSWIHCIHDGIVKMFTCQELCLSILICALRTLLIVRQGGRSLRGTSRTTAFDCVGVFALLLFQVHVKITMRTIIVVSLLLLLSMHGAMSAPKGVSASLKAKWNMTPFLLETRYSHGVFLTTHMHVSISKCHKLALDVKGHDRHNT